MKKNKRPLDNNKDYEEEERRVRFADRWTSNSKLSLTIFLVSLTYFSSCLELKSMSADLRALRRYVLDDKTIFQILRVLKNIDRRLENELGSIRRNVEDINFRVTRMQQRQRDFISLIPPYQPRNAPSSSVDVNREKVDEFTVGTNFDNDVEVSTSDVTTD